MNSSRLPRTDCGLSPMSDRFLRFAILFPQSSRRPNVLLFLCVLRAVLIPLFLICNLSPANRVHTPVLLYSDVAYILLTIIAGSSNGYLCTAAFVYAPKWVQHPGEDFSLSW